MSSLRRAWPYLGSEKSTAGVHGQERPRQRAARELAEVLLLSEAGLRVHGNNHHFILKEMTNQK